MNAGLPDLPTTEEDAGGFTRYQAQLLGLQGTEGSQEAGEFVGTFEPGFGIRGRPDLGVGRRYFADSVGGDPVEERFNYAAEVNFDGRSRGQAIDLAFQLWANGGDASADAMRHFLDTSLEVLEQRGPQFFEVGNTGMFNRASDQYAYRVVFTLQRTSPRGDIEMGAVSSRWLTHGALYDEASSMVAQEGQVRVITGAQFLPEAVQHVGHVAANVNLVGASSVTSQVVAVSLLALNLSSMLNGGNGLGFHTESRKFFNFDGLNGVLGSYPISTDHDCLFISLAIGQAMISMPPDSKNKARVLTHGWYRVEGKKLRTQVVRCGVIGGKSSLYRMDWEDSMKRPGQFEDVRIYAQFVLPIGCKVTVYDESYRIIREVGCLDAPFEQTVTIMFEGVTGHYTPLIKSFEIDWVNIRNAVKPTRNSIEQEIYESNARVYAHFKSPPSMPKIRNERTMRKAAYEYASQVPCLVRAVAPHGWMHERVVYMDMETQSVYKKEFDPRLENDVEIQSAFVQVPVLIGWVMVSRLKEYYQVLQEQEPWIHSGICEMDYQVREGVGCELKFWEYLFEATKEQQQNNVVAPPEDSTTELGPSLNDRHVRCRKRRNQNNNHKKDDGSLCVWAHNGHRFDFILLMRSLMTPAITGMFKLKKMTPRNGGFLSIVVVNTESGNKVSFMDTFFHLASSLDKLCKTFNPPHIKLTGSVDYSELTADNISNDPEIRERWMDYLRHDVLSLAEMFENYRREIWQGFYLDLCRDVYTSATFSKSAFLSGYYKERSHDRLFCLSAECESFVRKSYHGGRTEVFRHTMRSHIGKLIRRMDIEDKAPWVHLGRIYYYDFVSLYPSIMVEDLPAGKEVFREKITREEVRARLFYGFLQINVRWLRDSYTDEMVTSPYPPFLPYVVEGKGSKADGRLCFPRFKEWTTLVLFSEEVCFCLDHDLPYEFDWTNENVKGYAFKRGRTLEAFTRHMFARKRDAPNKVAKQTAKTAVNSIYGCMATRRTKETFCIFPLQTKSDVEKAYDDVISGEYTHVMVVDGCFFGSTMTSISSKTIVPSVASAVTANARIRLYRLMMKVVEAGGTLFYCDTDSLMTDMRLEEHPTLMTWLGKDLGQLSNELAESWGEEYAYADRYIALAPKMYSLRNTALEANKAKGGSKGFRNVDYGVLCKLWKDAYATEESDYKYVEDQLQFHFDKKSIFELPGQGFMVTRQNVVKHMTGRMIRGQFQKRHTIIGELDDVVSYDEPAPGYLEMEEETGMPEGETMDICLGQVEVVRDILGLINQELEKVRFEGGIGGSVCGGSTDENSVSGGWWEDLGQEDLFAD